MSDDDLDSYATTSNTVSPWGRRGMARITPRGDNSRDRSPSAGSASPTPSRGESPVLKRPSAAVATSAVRLSPAPMRREDSCSFGGRLKRGNGFGPADHAADEANLKAMDAAFKLGTAGNPSDSDGHAGADQKPAPAAGPGPDASRIQLRGCQCRQRCDSRQAKKRKSGKIVSSY